MTAQAENARLPRLGQKIKRFTGGKLAGEALWITLGQVASAIAALVGLRLITEVLSPDEFGLLILLVGFSALALNFSSNPILQATMRFHTEYDAAGQGRTLRHTSLRLYGIAIALGGLVLLAIGATIGPANGAPVWVGFVLAGLLAVDSIRAYETAMLNAARRQKSMSLWQASEACARPLAAVVAVVFFGGGAVTALFAYIAASLLINLSFSRLLSLVGATGAYDSAIAGTIRWRLFRYGLPLVPLGLLGWINGVGDRYLIAGLLSVADAGIYGAAYALVSRPYLMLGAFLDTWLRPNLYDAISTDDRSALRSTMLLWTATALVVGGLFTLTVVFAGSLITNLLLADEFTSASHLLSWFALGGIVINIQQLAERICHGYERTGFLVYADALTVALGLPIIVLGIKLAGIQGAAMASAIYLQIRALTFIAFALVAARSFNNKEAPVNP